jgi:transposase
MRPDLGELEAGELEIAVLQLLLARRRDLVTDQSRTITRLRETLVSMFPALERALDLNSKGPLTLLTHYQTPAQLRRAGHKRVATYLRNRGVKESNKVADKALAAAKAQSVTLPAQEVASRIVAELAKDILGFKERIEGIDEEIRQRFFSRPEARILTSLPGMGPILGAEFLVAVGDIRTFESADRLAAYAVYRTDPSSSTRSGSQTSPSLWLRSWRTSADGQWQPKLLWSSATACIFCRLRSCTPGSQCTEKVACAAYFGAPYPRWSSAS